MQNDFKLCKQFAKYLQETVKIQNNSGYGIAYMKHKQKTPQKQSISYKSWFFYHDWNSCIHLGVYMNESANVT